ncbi:hypothetical protein KC845_03650 [Candidatus Kaiserbacteria bacterium]|nr:hypothetical protein [Candidatus Kaiserbacteria bacterium]
MKINSFRPRVARRRELKDSLAKILTAVCFILLPFGGFWLGMQYAPLQIENNFMPASLPEPSLDSSTSSKTLANLNSDIQLNRYTDDEVGLTFLYPTIWGPVTKTDEVGECTDLSISDPCLERRYEFSDLIEGGYFMTVATKDYADNPAIRGVFWGDRAGSIDSKYAWQCGKLDTICVTYINNNDITFAQYPADALKEEVGWRPLRYEIYNPHGPYHGIILSSYGISTEEDDLESMFTQTVISSFEFLTEI